LVQAKDFLPGRPESLYEIGYHLFKRMSIFMISFIITFNSFGLMIIYNIIFGDVLSGLVKNVSDEDIPKIWVEKWTYCVMLTIILTPLVL